LLLLGLAAAGAAIAATVIVRLAAAGAARLFRLGGLLLGRGGRTGGHRLGKRFVLEWIEGLKAAPATHEETIVINQGGWTASLCWRAFECIP
jgi:hypothetical protein